MKQLYAQKLLESFTLYHFWLMHSCCIMKRATVVDTHQKLLEDEMMTEDVSRIIIMIRRRIIRNNNAEIFASDCSSSQFYTAFQYLSAPCFGFVALKAHPHHLFSASYMHYSGSGGTHYMYVVQHQRANDNLTFELNVQTELFLGDT